MILKTGKKDRTVHKDAIMHTNDLPEWRFIIMRNRHITAEDNFMRAMAVDGEYHRKMREISDFRRNGLPDSEVAMAELTRLYNEGFEGIRSKEDYTFRKAVQRLYNGLCAPSRDERKKTYDQHIPAEIRDLARVKGLFIERVDEICFDRDGKQRKANAQMRQAIRKERDCGYLIRNGKGEILIGSGYTLTDRAVVEFVRNYEPQQEDRGNYKVPLSQQEEKKYRFCRRILMKNGLRWRSQHDLRFWIMDRDHQVVFGGQSGVGLKKLYQLCVEMAKGREKRSDEIQKLSGLPDA